MKMGASFQFSQFRPIPFVFFFFKEENGDCKFERDAARFTYYFTRTNFLSRTVINYVKLEFLEYVIIICSLNYSNISSARVDRY